MNVQLLPLFQGESQVLVEMGDPRHGIAALERVAAAVACGPAAPQRNRRGVSVSDRSRPPEPGGLSPSGGTA